MPLEPINNNEKKFENVSFTVGGSGYESIPAGNYEARFDGVEPTETKKGKAYRWWFTIDVGPYANKKITELSDGDSEPRVTNKTGRFVCAMAKKPLEESVKANSGDYIGKRYLLNVIDNHKKPGETLIYAFSMLD